MHLDNFDDNDKNKSYTLATVIAVLMIVTIVAFVVLFNASKIKRLIGNDESKSTESVTETVDFVDEEEFSYESSGLTVSDLDFYEMYKETEDSNVTEESIDSSELKTEEEVNETNDGKHVSVTNKDGKVEWVAISPNLKKNDYDFTNLYNSNGKLKYFEGDTKVSTFGVDISKEQDYVDFNKLKKAGCEFVMLRVGTRGYQSGQINIDDYFLDNLKRATDAGLEVGVYFVSNAVTEAEAVEEAQFVIDNVGEYKLTYPVGFLMEYPENDTSRIDKLTKSEKTTITRAFLKKIAEAGFKPIVYGTKEWFLKEVDLVKLIGDFDMWLCETELNTPDYPYKYSMWQYNSTGSIDGISGDVSFDICFLDYTLK